MLPQSLFSNFGRILTYFLDFSIIQSREFRNGILDGIIELFETVITLAKSNNYSIEDLYERNNATYRDRGIKNFIALIEPIYKAYEDYLIANNEIDFNDMINKAASYIKEGKSQLTIAIGCTGGQHRSVALSERLAKDLTDKFAFSINTTHRDAAIEGTIHEKD